MWAKTTRGGYWVRNIHRDAIANGKFVIRGEIGNHCIDPPTSDERQWVFESWRENGRYQADDSQESEFDLIEVKK
jgi:hypothetical protein